MPLDIFKGWLSKAGYRDDQARDPHTGKWVSEGGRTSAAIARQGIDFSESDPYLGFIQEKGAYLAGQSIKNVLRRLPAPHRELLKGVSKQAVLDMARYATFLRLDPSKSSFAAGFFNPAMGVVIAEGFTNTRFGFVEFDDLEKFAAHEFGHAFDYYAVPGTEFGLSGALAGTLMSEYNNLSRAQRFYSEHYQAENLPKELFAEVYAAMYGRVSNPKEKNFVGYSLTQGGVLRRFPRTVAAIRDWQPS